MRSLWSFSALWKVINGVNISVGQLRSLGPTYNVFMMAESRTLKVPGWRWWATTVGQVNAMDVPKMVRATGPTNRDQAEHTLRTVVDLLEAPDDETVQIDGAVPPGFEEWCLKGVKSAWFAEMAPKYPWIALWKTKVLAITQEFMYKALWKKL